MALFLTKKDSSSIQGLLLDEHNEVSNLICFVLCALNLEHARCFYAVLFILCAVVA